MSPISMNQHQISFTPHVSLLRFYNRLELFSTAILNDQLEKVFQFKLNNTQKQTLNVFLENRYSLVLKIKMNYL